MSSGECWVNETNRVVTNVNERDSGQKVNEPDRAS